MKQLFTVDTNKKEMYITEDNKLIKTITDIWIGKNGTATKEEMKEGSMKTPLGKYNLGLSFGIKDLNINYPYIKIDDQSYWVDDTNSNLYNYFVQINKKIDNFDYPYIKIRNEKEFHSAEHLLDYHQQYEYAIFIEYNSPTKDNEILNNDKGSAIFLHCHGNKGYTGGCIAVKREDMKWIMEFIDRNKNPQIIIK